MSRQLRAGTPGKPRAFRVTDVEWTRWESAAKTEGCATVSAWVVQTLNARAARMLQSKSNKR